MRWPRLLSRMFRSNPPAGDDFWYESVSSRGSSITADTALMVTTVYACVRVLAESIASMPLHLMRDNGTRREKALDNPLYRVLHSEPNRRHTAFEFREMMQGHLALRGNAYALITVQSGTLELVPLHPDRMQVFVLDDMTDTAEMGRLGYLYRDRNGKPYRLTQDEVLHLRGLSFDGIMGVNPIEAGRRAIELSDEAEHHGIKWWKNAAKPGGVLKMPAGEYLDEDAHRRMKASWRSAHSGKDLYTVAILEGGAEWQAMSISNEDSEWLDSRRYQGVEICRLFRVQPHAVFFAIEHGNTYANVEQSDLNFVKQSLLPWIVRWEQSLNKTLIDDEDLYCKFAMESMLRADSLTRKEFYRGMLGMGVFSINDILELEDRNTIDDGDRRFIESSLTPLMDTGMMSTDSTPDTAVARAWLADAIERVVNAEARELDKQLAKQAAKDQIVKWAEEFYCGKHRDYVGKVLAPILASCMSPVDAQAVATHLTVQAMDEIRTGEPASVLNRWRNGRGRELADCLAKELFNDS